MQAELLEMMQQMTAQQGNSNAQSSAAAQGNTNAMLMKLLQDMQAKASAEHRPQEQLHSIKRKLDKQRRINQALTQQLQIASEFISQFADLVGACPQCLGQVDECPACAGRGVPGSRMPDPQLLKWIQPALALLRQQRPAPHPISTKENDQ
jgi:hypothetical protein